MRNVPQSSSKTLSVRQIAKPHQPLVVHSSSSSTTQDPVRAILSDRDVSGASEFGMWWTLEQRLSEWFASNWKSLEKDAEDASDAFSKLLSKASRKAADLLDMFEMPLSQLPLIMYALRKCKDDETAAMQLLLDEAEREKLEAVALKEMTQKASASGVLTKVINKTIDFIIDSPKVRFDSILVMAS